MSVRLTVSLALTLSVAATINGLPAAAGSETRNAFEQFARQFQFFGFSELLTGNTDLFLVDPKAKETYLPFLDDFLIRHDSPDELLPLLEHKDPKVRLLAVAALYNNEDAHFLPHIAKLIDDPGQLWPDPPPDVPMAKAAYGEPSPEPRTVGEAAREVLQHYLDAAAVPPGDLSEEFREYWNARQARSWCASWFLVKLRRADQVLSPISPERVPQIRVVRREVDRLPAVDRRYVLLQLATTPFLELTYFLSDEEITRICHVVGRDTLLALIAGKIKFDDPDLDPWKIGWLVFDHAMDLLRPDDAEAVLAAGNAIGAADLKPSMASKWLHAAYVPTLTGGDAEAHMKIVAALWRDVGPSETDFIVDWYFSKEHASKVLGSWRDAFLYKVKDCRRKELRKLVARIVADPRFDLTGAPSTRSIIQIVNGWLSEPLVSEQEMQDSYGHDEADSPNNPFKPLPEWHAKLRQSVKVWESGPTTK